VQHPVNCDKHINIMAQLIKIDPKEFGLEVNQATTIEQAFAPKIAERDGLLQVYEQVISSELTPALCDQAGELRKKLVKVRTGIADIHKTQKAFFLAAGRFVDAWKNKETAPIEQMEENLSKIEKHFIIIEQQRVAKLEADRKALLLQFTEIMPTGLGTMQDDVFEAYLNAQKVAYEAKIAAEKQAEIDRIEREKAEAAERERIRLENEKLKAEAIEREKAIAAERAAAAAKQKAIEDAARIEREKQATIIAKQQAELKAKQDAEAKAKAEVERIERERIAAEKAAAKAPDNVKLKLFIDSFVCPVIPELHTQEAKVTANVIAEKFEAFKKWAISQVN